MSKHLLLALIPASALLMTGCTDDNYDLDSIDKTSAISVNDLVVPVNLSDITLKNLIDTSDSFVELTNQQGQKYYAFKRNGSFKSDPIKIETFTIKAPTDLEPTSSGATKDENVDPDLNIATDIKYNIDRMRKDFTYEVRDVDSRVKFARQIETNDFYIKVILTVPKDMMQSGDRLTFRNLKIQFPKGLRCYKDGNENTFINAVPNLGSYDAESGMLTIANYSTNKPETELILKANVIDLNPPAGIENVKNSFDLDYSIIFESGSVILHTNNVGRLPDVFDFFAYYDLPSFNVEKFTGEINYTIEGLNFDPINLDDMPDVLADPETRIKIANPQIYLSIDNTCEPYNLGGEIGLELISNRDAGSVTYALPDEITVSNTVADNRYAISPSGNTLNAIDGFTTADGAVMMDFPELSEVLYGNDQVGYGIPENIDVNFTTSDIKGEAKRFPLATQIPAVTGNYDFIAPIALDKGSIIVYKGDSKDWDLGLDDLEVYNFTLQSVANSDLPIDLTLTAKILNKKGDVVGISDNLVIPASADNHPLTIIVNPTDKMSITDIDGIEYTAKASQDKTYDSPQQVPNITPDMVLKLSTLKATVNGRYITDFESNDKDDDNDNY